MHQGRLKAALEKRQSVLLHLHEPNSLWQRYMLSRQKPNVNPRRLQSPPPKPPAPRTHHIPVSATHRTTSFGGGRPCMLTQKLLRK